MTPDEREFLLSQRIGRLATVGAGGAPHILPVCFALVGDRLYTPIDEKPKRGDPATLRRLRDIAANPNVCLVVDHYDEDWRQLAWLQLRGQASLVLDPGERHDAIAALRARYPQYDAMRLEERPLIAITVERAVGWRAMQTPPRPLPICDREG